MFKQQRLKYSHIFCSYCLKENRPIKSLWYCWPSLASSEIKWGFDSDSCKWFQDYLAQRKQCVVLVNSRSTYLTLSKGVSQGSILGPVLFTLYINSVTSNIRNCNAHLYPDDTILFCSADTAHLAIQTLQQAFDQLQYTLSNLKLVLNSKKTKYMLFSKIKDVNDSGLSFTTLTGQSIERVSEYKYLGIWVSG